MSVKLGRSIVLLSFLAIAAVVISASCGGSQPASPTAPSALSSSTFVNGDRSTRSSTAADDEPVTGDQPDVADEDPAPTPDPPLPPVPEPPPSPDPAPKPAPAPAPNPATSPGPFPAPPSRFPVIWTPTPDTHEFLTLNVDPNPVPFSGVPVPLASCQNLAQTWYYTQIIHSRTGNVFRVTERENYFDGFLTSRTSVNLEIPAQQNLTIQSRWCSGYGKAHTAQHRFKAVDGSGREIILNGPLVQLQANPTYVPPPPAAQSIRARDNAILVWGD